ncbi:MAG: hypothetical protein ABFD96_25495, partial [Armatimonadia bacterium]
KNSKAALIGPGVRARIWLERAESDLAGSLDESQQAAQVTPANASATIEDDTLKVRREADADRAREEAKLAKLRVERESGRWIEAHKAQLAWGKELAEFVNRTETFIVNDLVRAIAEEHRLDWKALAVKARDRWRAYRGLEAEKASGEKTTDGVPG